MSQVDEIYIALRDITLSLLPQVNKLLAKYPVRIRVVPDLGSCSYMNTELINYGSLLVIQVTRDRSLIGHFCRQLRTMEPCLRIYLSLS